MKNSIHRYDAPAIFGAITIVALLLFSGTTSALDSGALPTGGKITYGKGRISIFGRQMTINQSTQKMIANWDTFNIGTNAGVTFRQPNSDAVALNKIYDQNPSLILGSLRANGNIFLINPSGIVFGQNARINVGGLVASSLNMLDSDFLAGKYTFTNNGHAGSVINQGNINASVVALIGPRVINEGTITATKGDVVMAAGNQVTLNFDRDGLISYTVDEGAIDALAANSGLIRADGGLVVMTAKAADNLTQAVVNNSGIIEAQTLRNKGGRIMLMSDMENGQTIVGGTLDASAPHGGNGGFIETSAANVKVNDTAVITTAAPKGETGTWEIDPYDFTIAPSGGDITGAAVTTALRSNNVTIKTLSDSVTCTGVTCGSGNPSGNGDIFVNDNISWSSNRILTLNAYRNIYINEEMNASGKARLYLYYGQGAADGVISGTTSNYYVNAPINIGEGNGKFRTKLGTGGTTINYYVITSLGDAVDATGGINQTLQGMARTANLATNYALGSNIDASATSGWNSGQGFTPVGTSTNNFTGRFEGLGHTVTGLTINRTDTDYQGMIGYIGSGSSVSNVGSVGGSVTGKNFVGQLAGFNLGTITKAYTTGGVTGNLEVGNLVGFNAGTITKSYATGSVIGHNDVGGLAGGNYGSIENSYAWGTVTGTFGGAYYVGGLVGYIAGPGTISNSYATGSIMNGTYRVGGLVGGSRGGTSTSFWNTETTGQTVSAGGTGKTNTEMKTASTYVGWDGTNTWNIVNGSYPTLK